ncbi:hypothetical protein Ciccas_011186 [Cichlidogyrus casuarinus]|uniref:RRM domain-containing protein n=1 Tax=Cichlidogyrus casuarinus TaxID=1844966 RepID=A0ABD2PSD4_9PLAT
MELEEVEEELYKKKTVTCRHCDGDHLAFRCPNRAAITGKGNLEEQEQPATISTRNYVPPTLCRPHSLLDRRRTEGHTIRVTNLPEDVNENWLKDRFMEFGKVTRVFPAKDKVTQLNRGFAFITYANKEDAQKAVDKINTVSCGHLVLGASWAK